MLDVLPPGNLRAVLTGGSMVLDSFDTKLASSTGDIVLEVNQFNDPGSLLALDVASRVSGTRLHMLADARVPDGGAEPEIRAYTTGRGGTYATYGETDEQWQHAKSYHFEGEDGPESWIGNLAPIPKSRERTELSLVVGGDAAASARDIATAALRSPGSASVRDAATAASSFGVLSNDPHAKVSTLTEAIGEVLHAPRGRDLLVVTKGIEHPDSTSAIIDAHRAGRLVQVYVRDLALADGERLASAGVPVTILRGGLQPRVNAFFAGDRGVTSTAFLWNNMVGDAPTARDAGVLVDGLQGEQVRDAAMRATGQSPEHVALADALRAGELPEHI